MKNKTWKFALICSLIVMGFTACDDDDEYYYVGGGGSWLSYGNLEKIDNGSRSKFAIRRDDGNRLIVTEGMPINFDGAEEDLRVYAHYSIVGSERDESGLEGNMNYYVRLYGLDASGMIDRYFDVLKKMENEHETASVSAPMSLDKFGAGYGWQKALDVTAINETPAYYCSMLEKITRLVESKVNSANRDDAAHYQSLLLILKSVKK